MLTGGEAVTVVRVLLLAGIVGSVVGLKLLKSGPITSEAAAAAGAGAAGGDETGAAEEAAGRRPRR
jgi:quaternary ammonium compound-resistance protein SugE